MFLLGFILYGTLCASWSLLTIYFSIFGIFSTIYSLQKFSHILSFTDLLLDPCNSNVSVFFLLSQKSLRLNSVLFIPFTLFCSSEVISTILPSWSLLYSSAWDILLLIPSRVFSISAIVLFVCLFFNFSRSLLIDSYIFFSILFSRLLVIFTVIILNSLSGSLPISSLYLGSYVSFFFFLPFISVVLLCRFIIIFFNLLCLTSPFPWLQGKFELFLFWFVQWFV